MRYEIHEVEVLRHPILRVTFTDDYSGEMDLSRCIASGGPFAPLADPALFREVAVSRDRRVFGWRLDRPGEEIDLCADSTRIDLETQAIEALAENWRARRTAAE